MKRIFTGILAGILAVLLTAGVCAATPETLIPGGNAVGLHLQTDGVTIVDFSNELPKKAGLQTGDRISAVNGTAVNSAEQLSETVSNCNGTPLKLTILRENDQRTITLSPTQTAHGWRLGLYVRDSVNGIGTVTYYNTQNHTFGALGHGVNDGKTLLPIRSGSALPTQVASVCRGKKGTPGALQGVLNGRSVCGTIEKNTSRGIFGTTSTVPTENKPLPVAASSEIHTGKATILSNVRGTAVEEFDIEIRACYPNDAHDRNLLLEVKDADLLEQTGGIVQGMSGSPILQDGKLIGAVTHVLIDDPTQGYGIFIENMLNAAA